MLSEQAPILKVLACPETVRSGTTGVAARELGHRFIGFDIDPDYIALAASRVEEEDQASAA